MQFAQGPHPLVGPKGEEEKRQEKGEEGFFHRITSDSRGAAFEGPEMAPLISIGVTHPTARVNEVRAEGVSAGMRRLRGRFPWG